MSQGVTHCSHSCANKCRTQSDEARKRISEGVRAAYTKQNSRRGPKPFELPSGRVIQVDSLWEAQLYAYLEKACGHSWRYANEDPYFVTKGQFGWKPDFVIPKFQGRTLIIEVKGHPKAVSWFEQYHYPILTTEETIQQQYYIGLLLDQGDIPSIDQPFEVLLQRLYWIFAPVGIENPREYLPGLMYTAPQWQDETPFISEDEKEERERIKSERSSVAGLAYHQTSAGILQDERASTRMIGKKQSEEVKQKIRRAVIESHRRKGHTVKTLDEE
ncbi:MAG: hypothetical protein WC895_05065 [Candidatus Shapirobacteria bacterium]|jgi:hypothetical protein